MAIALGCPSPAAPVRDDRLCAPGPGAGPSSVAHVGPAANAALRRQTFCEPRPIRRGSVIVLIRAISLASRRGHSRAPVSCYQDVDMTGDSSSAGNSPSPGAEPKLRASHGDRERAVDTLRIAAGDGRLTAEELDERLEAALSARTLGELDALTADLAAAPGQPSGSAPPAKTWSGLARAVVSPHVEAAGGFRSGWTRCWPKPGPRSTSPRR